MSNHLFIRLSQCVSLSFSAWHSREDNARKISNSIEKLGTVSFLSSKFHTPWSLLAFTTEKNPDCVAGLFMILFFDKNSLNYGNRSQFIQWNVQLITRFRKSELPCQPSLFLCILFYWHSSVCWHAHEISFKKFVSHFSGNLLKKIVFSILNYVKLHFLQTILII